MQTDKQIKREATNTEFKRVFVKFSQPLDIYAQCSDGLYVRKAWINPNGNFGWDKWTKETN